MGNFLQFRVSYGIYIVRNTALMNVRSFNDVSMGDALRIETDAATSHVFMTGPAVEALQGEIALAD